MSEVNIGDALNSPKPWEFDLDKLKVIPNEHTIAVRLPEDEQPKASLVIHTPQNAVRGMAVRLRAIAVGPGRALLGGGNDKPKIKVGDILVMFESNGIALTHLGNNVFFVPDMNVIYVEPRED